jgi:hypothetical protein
LFTGCVRRLCQEEASYYVRDNRKVLLCSNHAADICDTDVVVEIKHLRAAGAVAA